jgi:L-alanine-DL-glutamate epimerase-like enolase superfamily enzyme
MTASSTFEGPTGVEAEQFEVAEVEAIPIAYPEPNDHHRTRFVCLTKVTTRDGVSGWGEAATHFEEAAVPVARLIDALGPVVVGQNALENISIWRALREKTWWYGTGVGFAAFAISAIDTALWDLKGKLLNTSVLDLLGGPSKDALPAMGSSHGTKADVGEMADEIAGWLETGLQGIKVGFGKLGDANLGFEQKRDVAFVRAVREAIGEKKLIMIDLGVRNHWDVQTAIERAQAFEEYGVYWLEEPLGHDDPEGYETLRAATRIRMAYGEREWNVAGVDKLVRTGTVDVVGLDPGRLEGLTGFARACDVCETARCQANAHAWSTAISTASSNTLSWYAPACHQVEVQPVYGPMQTDLVAQPIQHQQGWMPKPSGAGLGIEVQEDVVARFRIDR